MLTKFMRFVGLPVLIALLSIAINVQKSYGQCDIKRSLSVKLSKGCGQKLATFVIQPRLDTTKAKLDSITLYWDFADGNGFRQDANDSIAKVFTPGSYKVRVYTKSIRRNIQGQICDTLTVTVNNLNLPTPVFSSTTAKFCNPPYKITLNDNTVINPGVPFSYRKFIITGPNGTKTDSLGPSKTQDTFTLTQYGAYTVTLQLFDSNGCNSVLIKKSFINIPEPISIDFCSALRHGVTAAERDSLTGTLTPKVLTGGSSIVKFIWNVGGIKDSLTTTPSNLAAKKIDIATIDSMPANARTVTLIAMTKDGCADTVIQTNLLTRYYKSNTVDETCLKSNIPFQITGTGFSGGKTGTGVASNRVSTVTRIHPRIWDFRFTETGLADVKIGFYYGAGTCGNTVTVPNYFNSLAPKADFSSLARAGCGPKDTIRLVATNKYPNSTYKWYLIDTAKIGPLNPPIILDSIISTSATTNGSDSFILPSANAPTPNLYSVALKIITKSPTGKICTDSIFKYGFIFIAKPTASFSLPKNIVCNGDKVPVINLTTPRDTTSTPYRYTWTFTHRTKPAIVKLFTVKNPDVKLDTPGVYSVKLDVQNSLNCYDDTLINDSVTVNGVVADVLFDTTNLCPPIKGAKIFGKLNDSVPTTATYTWNWSILRSDGSRKGIKIADSTKRGTTVDIDSIGAYNLTLVVKSSAGCSTEVKKASVISVGTNAEFNANSRACLNTALQLNNTSKLSPTRFDWSVLTKPTGSNPKFNGSTSTSTDENPTITFNAPGYYRVLLKTGKKGKASCEDTFSQAIEVINPKASFSSNDTSKICAPQLVNFIASPKGMLKYSWRFQVGDSFTDFNDQKASMYYTKNNPTGFDVTLKITSTEGCTDSITKKAFIKIYGPVPSFTLSATEACGSAIITITNTSQNIGKFLFNFKDGTPLDTVPFTSVNHPYIYGDYDSAKITYYPELITSDPQLTCFSTFTGKIVLNRPPIANFDITNPLPISGKVVGCTPLRVNFLDQSRFGTTREWYLDADTTNAVSSQQVYSKVFATPGKHSIFMRARNLKCQDTIGKYNVITVYETPKASIGFGVGRSCPGDDITFSDSGSTGNITDWLWDFGDGSTPSTDVQPTYKYTTAGTYPVTLTVQTTNPDGSHCRDSTTKFYVISSGNKPNQPEIKYVTVDTTSNPLNPSGTVRVFWKGFAGLPQDFESYNLFKDPISGVYYNTTNINELTYNDAAITVDPFNNTYTYWMKILNPCGLISDSSFIHTTVKLDAIPVTLAQGGANQLNWTPYIGWSNTGGVKEYQIHRKDNGGAFTKYNLVAKVDGSTTSYSDTGLCNNLYRYVVVAVNNSDSTIKSMSNKDSVQVNYVFPTRVIVRYATVHNNTYPKLKWDRNPSYLVTNYIIERSSVIDGTPFVQVASVPANTLEFIDTTDKTVDVNKGVYQYRVAVQDKCGYVSPYSNVGTTILLAGEVDKSELNYLLTWTPYDSFENAVAGYFLQLKDKNNVWSTVKALDAVTIQTIFDSLIAVADLDGPACFRIVGVSNQGTTFPIMVDSSLSNEVCLTLPSVVWVPNAFTPGSNTIGINDVFKPFLLSLIGNSDNEDLQYEFNVYNRWGVRVFETNDRAKGWDGQMKGKDCPQGVYVYTVKARGQDKKTIFRKGSVMLVR